MMINNFIISQSALLKPHIWPLMGSRFHLQLISIGDPIKHLTFWRVETRKPSVPRSRNILLAILGNIKHWKLQHYLCEFAERIDNQGKSITLIAHTQSINKTITATASAQSTGTETEERMRMETEDGSSGLKSFKSAHSTTPRDIY